MHIHTIKYLQSKITRHKNNLVEINECINRAKEDKRHEVAFVLEDRLESVSNQIVKFNKQIQFLISN